MGNLIVMAWLLSLGLVPNSSLETKNGSINASDCLVQNFGVGFYLADHIHVYSTVEIRETKSYSVYYDPFRADFLIGGEVYYNNLSIGGLLIGDFSIGILHECNHDIVTSIKFHKYNGWEAAFDKAYINYTRPIRISPEITITPSITLTDQFTERLCIKQNDKKRYFDYIKIDTSPNIFSPEFRLEIEFFYLRSYTAFEAGCTTHSNEWAYTQFNLGVELFYKNISLGFDYINRGNMQKNAGYSLKRLMFFIRFQGKSSLL